MSTVLVIALSILGIAVVVSLLTWLMTCIQITPICPQCEKVGEIYDSNVSEAWLDCVCHDCGYKWRIK